MKGKNDLNQWIRKQLYVERDEGQPARFVLKHVGAGNKLGSEVCAIAVPKNPAQRGDDFVEATIGELEATANQDAGGLGGVQSYVVQAYFHGEEKPLARYTFKVQGADDDDEGGSMSSEPPNKVGITSQLMRHQEAIFRTAVMSNSQVVGTLMRQNQMLADMVEKFMADRVDSVNVLEQMLSRKQERELEVQQATAKQAMLQDAFDKVMTLAPVVVAKIAGKGVVPGVESPIEVQIKGFLETITPDQLETLSGALKPEQQLALAEMYQALQEAEKKRAEAKEVKGKQKALKGKET